MSLRAHASRVLATLLVLLGGASAALAQGYVDQPKDRPYAGEIQLEVDVRDLDHKIFQVRQRLPVRPGPLVLFFPRYLPGTHGPYGNIDRLAGLTLRAGERVLSWHRDTLDAYAFHVDVPGGVGELDLSYQYLPQVSTKDLDDAVTRKFVNLQWLNAVVYPAGHLARQIRVAPRLTLPPGWKQASALQVAEIQTDAAGDTVRYAPVDLETLGDSPVFAGAHMKRIELESPAATRPVALNLFAEDPDELKADEVQLEAHRKLVQQAERLFGSRHFERYEFLLSISDVAGSGGLEHHQSSENGVEAGYFKDWDKRIGSRDLLAHEFAHSWNGKFRRPVGLLLPHYNLPMRDDLLWLYEGGTEYWGWVLAVRSGLITPAQLRDHLASMVALFDELRPGQRWRSLQDTTNQPALRGRDRRADWRSWQRSEDYYVEGALMWLEADALIRTQSQGQKSLDDFAQTFFGVDNGRVQPLAYDFDDVVKALQATWPNDWSGFLRERLDRRKPFETQRVLAKTGWKLAWADTPSAFQKAERAANKDDDFALALGLWLDAKGTIVTVIWDGPAFKAGLRRGLELIAVNGMAYKSERLAEALAANKDGKQPIDLLIKEDESYRSIKLDVRGGARYPRLERVEGSADVLDPGIFAPRRP